MKKEPWAYAKGPERWTQKSHWQEWPLGRHLVPAKGITKPEITEKKRYYKDMIRQGRATPVSDRAASLKRLQVSYTKGFDQRQ